MNDISEPRSATSNLCTCPNASYGVKHSYGCLEGQIERLLALADVQRSIERNTAYEQDVARLGAALQKIIDEGDYTAPEGMKRIASEALSANPSAPETSRDESAWLIEMAGERAR